MCMYDISPERESYLENKKKEGRRERLCRICFLAVFLLLWEISARLYIVDPFIVSSPARIVGTIVSLACSGELFYHTMVTTLEALAGFFLGTFFGVLIATLLWWENFLNKVAEPYLVILNALPKIALGPVFIVWLGSGPFSIIMIALTVSIVVSILEVLSGFMQTDRGMIKLVKSFGGSKKDILFKVVFPANIKNIFSSLKINMGMSWVGVVVGEFLISKAGLGYLIVYGSQVFKLDLVMASVVILAFVAAVMYLFIEWSNRLLKKKSRHF